MSATYDDILQRARDWAQSAVAQNWLQPLDVRELTGLESRTPGSMFLPGTHRPLVAAFFGGTGVGKSSLLNRLAGQPVARTGVERPTSREISVYLHASVQISSLPNDFPLDRVRTAQHQNDAARQVMWVDMPDFDSVEQHNRELVLEWLPHIDVLIYVVSPERYRDDKGWRLLCEHGGDHAWLFVLNQWDRGQAVQYDDFRRLLGTAGFADPVVLRTDCREHPADRKPDDFAVLQSILQEISDRHVLSQLEARNEQARIHALQDAIGAVLDRLGTRQGYRSLGSDWTWIWDSAQADLMSGLEWPMQSVVGLYTQREASPIRRSLELTQPAEAENKSPARTDASLWDEWSQGRVQDAVGQLVVEAGHQGLPVLPLRAALASWPQEAGKQVLSRGQLMLRQALAQPGNGLQRFGLKLLGGLSVLLPLAALGWASYEVVKGYYESATRHMDFLGTDFAIHSLLLIGLAWLLPWFACTRLRPSIEKSALKGLRSGVSSALVAVGEQIHAELESADRDRDAVLGEGRAIIEQSQALQQPASAGHLPELLGRMLPAGGKPVS